MARLDFIMIWLYFVIFEYGPVIKLRFFSIPPGDLIYFPWAAFELLNILFCKNQTELLFFFCIVSDNFCCCSISNV